MALTPISAADALAQFDSFNAIIDARSESEYALDHLPGAANWPTLNDQERHEIGTQYVQISAFDARKRGAVMALWGFTLVTGLAGVVLARLTGVGAAVKREAPVQITSKGQVVGLWDKDPKGNVSVQIKAGNLSAAKEKRLREFLEKLFD